MNNSKMKYCCAFLLAIMFWGCPSTAHKETKETSLQPEMEIRIASLDLENYNKRFEIKQIVELSKALKREQVEILAVQGITRYPGIATRVDFVDELSSKTEWRNSFGEMVNISGRQTGNAIFSYYPILSHSNQPFDQIKRTFFEAALQSTIDVGVRSLKVVCLKMPAKATREEQIKCTQLATRSDDTEKNQVMFVSGNLPSDEFTQGSNKFVEISHQESAKAAVPKLWYLQNTSCQLLSIRIVETDFGKLTIARVGIARQQ